MEQIPQSVIDKIQKLLNLKEGAESIGSLAEAENAGAKMQDLLMKYNLDLETVKAQSIADKVQVNVEEVYIDTEKYTRPHESFWVARLFYGVARNNLCVVWWIRGKFGVDIVGHSHNIALVSYICDQLMDKIRIAEKYAWKDYHDENPHGEKRGLFRRGFLEGASVGIDNRLQDEYIKMQTEANQFAVMIVSKKEEVKNYLYEKYPYLNPSNKPTPIPHDPNEKLKKIKIPKGPRENSSLMGFARGREAGNRMEINRGVGGNTNAIKGKIN